MKENYNWIIVGAGVSGVIAVAKILDEGENPENILWIDNNFNGGDIAKKWPEVPGNTKVDFFLKSLKRYNSIDFENLNIELKNLDPEKICLLGKLGDALKIITKCFLEKKVNNYKGLVKSVSTEEKFLRILTAENNEIITKKIIFATGGEPKENFKRGNISIDIALTPSKLKKFNLNNKTVGVVGSSHSAILVLKNLVELNQNFKIYNFYKEFLIYAMPFNGKTIYDNTGLKGVGAEWAKKNLGKNNNNNIRQIQIEEKDYQKSYNKCDIIIDATGFTPRNIEINGIVNYKHNPHHGIIAPNIYGIGIAYPEKVQDEFGNVEFNVGMFKFANFIDKVFPLWNI